VAKRAAQIDPRTLRERYAAHGQGHVFRYWDELDERARRGFAAQLAEIDLDALLPAFEATRADAQAGHPALEPIAAELLPERGGDAERIAAARRRGEALLAAGRVAVMVVAGGQATRLGFPGPKGGFPLGPVTQRSLFGQQAQKLRRLRAQSGRPVPWYVMTSEATDAATRLLFARADHFGLPAADVFFLRQGMVPSFDFDGKLILERPDRLFQNPNGHGGSLTALLDSGALDDMARRGIDTIFYYQVDNPLAPIGDPVLLGFHTEADAEMSCKVIRKCEPGEKLGVLAQVDGRIRVVEYTEIDDEHRDARDAAGELLHWAGNIALHAFCVDFVRRVAAEADRLLPYHSSAKAIPTIDADGNALKPDEPNGYKLERFVFDALAATERVCVVEARREEEYSPIKNADGTDSPLTARRDLSARYRSWLEQAGIDAPRPGLAIEIDESRVGGPEDLRALGVRHFSEASDVVRTAAGDER
jgi:UDP-N-acetylglucosamine/UDP-N-acetylgalactosamine diphosphorylase